MDLCKFESFCGKSDVWMDGWKDGWMDGCIVLGLGKTFLDSFCDVRCENISLASRLLEPK